MFRLSPRAVPAALLLSTLSLAAGDRASAEPFDGKPKVLLHVTSPAMKNRCDRGALADCREAATSGDLNAPSYVYLLLARGSMPDIAAMEVGLSYQDRAPGNVADSKGIDIFSWTNCATLDFPTPAPWLWPCPGSGNLVAWDRDNVCQTGETAVVGYFYLTAYSPDVLQLIPRPVSGHATLADCDAVEYPLAPGDLGYVSFPATPAGCNPCLESCPDVVPTPVCRIDPPALDFGTTLYAWRTVTIRNMGGGVLDGRIRLDSRDFHVAGQTSFSLTAYGATTFRVYYGPGTVGRHTATMDLGTGCPGYVLTGNSPAPKGTACRMYPGAVQFGRVPVGKTRTQTFMVWNDGDSLLVGNAGESCADFTLAGPSHFELARGDTAFFSLSFTPSHAGSFTCKTDFGTDCSGFWGGGTGYTTSAPQCAVTPSIVDFGPTEIGKVARWFFTVHNFGGGCVAIDPGITGQGFSLVPGGGTEACQTDGVPVEIEFTPGQVGAYEGTVKVNDGCAVITLRGEGRIAGPGRLSPEALDFGTVPLGSSAERVVTLSNTGPLPISGSLAELCGTFSIAGDANYTLDPGASMEFRIAFEPDETGSFRCVIDGGANATVLPCTGTGTATIPIRPTTWSDIKTRFIDE